MCGQMAGEAWGQLGRLDIRRTSAQKLALWRCIAQVDTPLRHWCASAHQYCTQLHEPEAALIKCADGASAETMSSMLSSSKSVGFGVGAPSIPWAKRHLLTPGRVKRRRMSGNLQIRRRIGSRLDAALGKSSGSAGCSSTPNSLISASSNMASMENPSRQLPVRSCCSSRTATLSKRQRKVRLRNTRRLKELTWSCPTARTRDHDSHGGPPMKAKTHFDLIAPSQNFLT